MSPDEEAAVVKLQTEMEFIREDFKELRCDVRKHGVGIGEIKVAMATVLERLPDRKGDHRRGDDPPDEDKKSWLWWAKLVSLIGIGIGSTAAAWQAGPILSKMVGGQ